MNAYGRSKQIDSILIVDDDPRILRDLDRALQAHLSRQHSNIKIDTARNGNEALAQILTEAPSLMIMELALKKRSGILVLEYLRLETELTFPILVLTRQIGLRVRAYTELLGVQGYLVKPQQTSDIIAQVTQIIAQPVC